MNRPGYKPLPAAFDSNIENVLFLKAVDDFKALLIRRKASEDDIFASATAIFNQYIDAQSPMEVNLPARISKIYRKPEGFDESRRSEVLNENYFDEASASITKLLHDDSLPRFKRAHRDVWARFVASQNEVKLMSNIKVMGSSIPLKGGSMGTLKRIGLSVTIDRAVIVE